MASQDARTDSPSSVTTPPSAGAYLRDETALRRAFDAEFAGAMAAAREKLQNAPALAPRVVETAFVNVWQQRATLTSLQQFKKVLQDEVTHGAARALSRRVSAQRFGGSASRDEQTMTGTHPATAQADAVLASVASPNIQPIASGAGQTGTAKLGDGTAAQMGPDSKVFIPDGFG